MKLSKENQLLIDTLKKEFPHLKPRHWDLILNKFIALAGEKRIRAAAEKYKPEEKLLKAALKDKNLRAQIMKIASQATTPPDDEKAAS
jgi:hypothetical protein